LGNDVKKVKNSSFITQSAEEFESKGSYPEVRGTKKRK